MALPAIGQENTLHIRMPVEADAKHVEDFTLQPVCGCPDRHSAGDALAIRDHCFYANAFVPGERIQNPDDLELFFPLRIMHRGDIHAVVELLPVAQNLEYFGSNRSFDDYVILAKVSIGFADTGAVLAL